MLRKERKRSFKYISKQIRIDLNNDVKKGIFVKTDALTGPNIDEVST